MTFVERIDLKLKEKNVKRIALCKDVGIDITIISAWKTRGTIPSADIALKIAKYLNVSVEWLITGEEINDNTISIGKQTIKEILQKVQELLDFVEGKIKE